MAEEFHIPNGYRTVRTEFVEELGAKAYLLRHEKSGARVFVISCDDKNKVFSIAFRTQVENSRGIPHIIEHSVLCGSKEFPVKEPFVELCKSSLNTFLNAMTYPDKTIFPVASCNLKDFKNLMHVYMDAVFYPNIYTNEKIFRQEGWHYEMEDENSPLTINGVVYNEMKGAFSSPDEVMDDISSTALLKGSEYEYVSGGAPDVIPELSYEEFLAFHKKNYHPSNSYIYLYGDCDMEERLIWLADNYLNKFDAIEVVLPLPEAVKLEKPLMLKEDYPVGTASEEKNGWFYSWHAAAGNALDPELYIAFSILEYALLESSGAPVKKALQDAGIGDDIYGGYYNGIYLPYFSIIAKNGPAGKQEDFVNVLKSTLQKICEEGISEKTLRAAINYYEFKYYEADFGYPKGLMFGIQALDSWLYDENDPFMHICYRKTFESLKAKVGTGYYENLIRTYILDNKQAVSTVLRPVAGLEAARSKAFTDRMEAKKASFTAEQIRDIVEQTRILKEYQGTPDTPEALATIPMLTREDIDPKLEPMKNQYILEKDFRMLFHNYGDGRIHYMTLLFPLAGFSEDELCLAGLLKHVLGAMDTTKHDYSDFCDEILLETGGIYTDVSVYQDRHEPEKYQAYFIVKGKCIDGHQENMLELMREMIQDTVFRNQQRLREILIEVRARIQQQFIRSAHSTAIARCEAYYNPAARINDLTDGYALYQFMTQISEELKVGRLSLENLLDDLSKKIFVREDVLVSYTAKQSQMRPMILSLTKFLEKMPAPRRHEPRKTWLKLNQKNEGFKAAIGVQYVARCGNFRQAGFDYTGSMRILSNALTYGYLWQEVRVKGGAYGVFCGMGPGGEGYFASYRDPGLLETNKVFLSVPEQLRNFRADENEMTKIIIGTIAGMDAPLSVSAKGRKALNCYLSHVSDVERQRERDEILSATEEDIRNTADAVQAVLDAGNICVIGSEKAIEKNRELFGSVLSLLGKEEE